MGWMVNVFNVSVTPFSYTEDFTGDNAVLAHDKLLIGFRANTVFRVRPDRVKEFVEQYTTMNEGKDQVQVAFGKLPQGAAADTDPCKRRAIRRIHPQ